MIYDVTQETEEEMPYTADQPFNSWGDDVPEIRIVDESCLTPRQIALRDGFVETTPSAGLARQQRLANMEQNIADLADFIADCDRYAEFMNGLESPCVSPHVPRLMGNHLRERRAEAVLKGRRLRSELAILRRQG